MDALLDLFESDAKMKVETSEIPVDSSFSKDDRESLKENKPTSANSTNTLDPISKIRIVSRKLSRAEQVDLLAPYQYHSSVAIASMNNQALSSLIVSTRTTSMESNSCAVNGKTNMATIGIVFSVSPTKISSKGASFIAMSIGELHSGPAVSILVFGDAYSAYAGKISNGQVIAIVASTILPPKAGSGDTRITLTVRDVAQITIIGTAQDYGLCSGTDTRKINGTMETVRCKMHVDKRLGCLCKIHNRTNQEGSWKKKKMTFVESLKDNRIQIHHHLQMSNPSFLHQHFNNGIKMSGPIKPILSLSHQETNDGKLRSLLSMEKGHSNPGHSMRIQHHSKTQDSQLVLPQKQGRNPYANRTKLVVDRVEPRNTIDLLGIALSKNATDPMDRYGVPSSNRCNIPTPVTSTPSQASSIRTLKTNTCVPVASTSLLPPIPLSLKPTQASSSKCPKQDYASVAQMVLDEQKKISLAMKKRKGQNVKAIPPVKTFHGTAKSASFEAMFGQSLGKNETIQVLETKSRFSAQAEDELYVQARLKVTELEIKEEIKQKTEDIAEKKRKLRGSGGCIESVWKCHTCQLVYNHRPTLCMQSKHLVGISRNIKNVVHSKNEERLRISRASVEEGGLILGKGINWNKLQDGSDSE